MCGLGAQPVEEKPDAAPPLVGMAALFVFYMIMAVLACGALGAGDVRPVASEAAGSMGRSDGR